MKFYSRVFCFCFQLFYDELFFVFFCTSLLSKEVWLLLGRPIRWTLVFHFFVHQVTRCTRSQVPFFPLLHFYKKTHAEPRPFFKLLCLHIGFVRIGKAYIQLSSFLYPGHIFPSVLPASVLQENESWCVVAFVSTAFEHCVVVLLALFRLFSVVAQQVLNSLWLMTVYWLTGEAPRCIRVLITTQLWKTKAAEKKLHTAKLHS